MKSTKIFLLCLVVAALSLLGQSPSKKKPAPKKQEDPEARWICRIGSYHDCHCPAMMAEIQEEGIKHCADTSGTREDYLACVSKLPSNCEIVQSADKKHPEHTCKRTCKAMAGCQCDDGPVCKGPVVYHPEEDSSDETLQNQ